jgi:histidinol phosphatase-like enzyme
MLLEVEDFQNRERKVSEKADAEKAVLKGLVDGLREKNEELTNQIGAIGGAIDSMVVEIAMMKFKENPEMLHDAIQRLSSSADELLVVVDQIEDYEAVANFTRQIEAVQKKMRGYVDLWEKNLRGRE